MNFEVGRDMEFRSSFRHVPVILKVFYPFMLIGVPAIMLTFILLMFFVVELKEIFGYAIAGSFLIAAPFVSGRQLLDRKKLTLTPGSIKYKAFLRNIEVSYSEIIKVIALRNEKQFVVLAFPREFRRVVGMDHWFSMSDREEFLRMMMKISQEHGFEVRMTSTRKEAESARNAMYRDLRSR